MNFYSRSRSARCSLQIIEEFEYEVHVVDKAFNFYEVIKDGKVHFTDLNLYYNQLENLKELKPFLKAIYFKFYATLKCPFFRNQNYLKSNHVHFNLFSIRTRTLTFKDILIYLVTYLTITDTIPKIYISLKIIKLKLKLKLKLKFAKNTTAATPLVTRSKVLSKSHLLFRTIVLTVLLKTTTTSSSTSENDYNRSKMSAIKLTVRLVAKVAMRRTPWRELRFWNLLICRHKINYYKNESKINISIIVIIRMILCLVLSLRNIYKPPILKHKGKNLERMTIKSIVVVTADIALCLRLDVRKIEFVIVIVNKRKKRYSSIVRISTELHIKLNKVKRTKYAQSPPRSHKNIEIYLNLLFLSFSNVFDSARQRDNSPGLVITRNGQPQQEWSSGGPGGPRCPCRRRTRYRRNAMDVYETKEKDLKRRHKRTILKRRYWQKKNLIWLFISELNLTFVFIFLITVFILCCVVKIFMPIFYCTNNYYFHSNVMKLTFTFILSKLRLRTRVNFFNSVCEEINKYYNICFSNNISRLVLVIYLGLGLNTLNPMKPKSRDTSICWLCGLKMKTNKLVFKKLTHIKTSKTIKTFESLNSCLNLVWTQDRQPKTLFDKVTDNRYAKMLIYLKLMNDIELNPGPLPTSTYTNNSLQISTINCRGLGKINKFTLLLNKVAELNRINQNSIFLLQETMVKDERYLQMAWRGNYALTAGTGNSQGCITLVSSDINLSNQIDFGNRGHYIELEGLLTSKAAILNIYAPNGYGNDKRDFFNDVLERVETSPCHNIIIAGDLNLTFNESDRLNRNVTVGEANIANFVKDKIDELGLVDAWQGYTGMTWKRGKVMSWLDRIYTRIANYNQQGIDTDWTFCDSDHALVRATFIEINSKKNGTKVCRLDPRVVIQTESLNHLRNYLTEQINMLSSDADPHLALEFVKMTIRTKSLELGKKIQRC